MILKSASGRVRHSCDDDSMDLSWIVPFIQKRLHEGCRLGMQRRLPGGLGKRVREEGSVPMSFELLPCHCDRGC